MPKPVRIILENLGQWGCSSGQFVAHVLFFGPPCEGPPCPRLVRDPPLWCGCVVKVWCCVVVWCVGAVCSKFSWVRPKFGRSPDSPPPDPSPDSTSSAGPSSTGPPSAGPPKISLFFSLSRHNFHSFFLSWGSFRGILVVVEGRDPQKCMFGLSGCRVKPRRLWGRPGSTRQLQTCTFVRPGASNTTKIPREDPPVREE